jgi:septal ring factor EnvC (AmiA/AmiB activator)
MSEPKQESGCKMEPADALRMLSSGHGWLQGQLRQSKNCECGACALCAFYLIEQMILDSRRLRAQVEQQQTTLAEQAQRIEELEREQKTIESICFGGFLPNDWNLDGLAGRAHAALMAHAKELREAKSRAADLRTTLDVTQADLTAANQTIKSMGEQSDVWRGLLVEWLAVEKQIGPRDSIVGPHTALIEKTEQALSRERQEKEGRG